MTLTPADSTTLLCEILMLKQLRDKKTAESTLPKNYVVRFFGAPRVVNGFIEFQKQKSDPLRKACPDPTPTTPNGDCLHLHLVECVKFA